MKRYFLNTTWDNAQFFTAEPVGNRLHLERGEPDQVPHQWREQYADAPTCQQHADRWISEEMGMGYVEVAATHPAVATAGPAAAAVPALQLLPERVRGQRIKLAHFTWYRLGSREEVARLLTAHGATVLHEYDAADDGADFDFYLGGLALMSGEAFDRPVIFEEELCVPLPVADELAWFKPRLWAMLRGLLRHPAVVVNRFSVGLPNTEDELVRIEARLGRPLPRLLRAFYLQVGELQLLWAYRDEAASVAGEGMWNIDDNDSHQGDINIWPLQVVLEGEWTSEEYGITPGLTENQKLFDYYSEYHQMAIEVGNDEDPRLPLGEDYGACFDYAKPIRFSDYLSVLLHTYGFKERERLFGNTLGGRFAAADETALQGLAALDLFNPFEKNLDLPANFASIHDDNYVPEEGPDDGLVAAAGEGAAGAAAPIGPPVSEPLAAAGGTAPSGKFVAVESPFAITDSAHKAAFAVANPGRTPLTVRGYVARFVAAAAGQEVVLATDDSATHRDAMAGYTHVGQGMFMFFSASQGLCIEPLFLSEMPVEVPARHRTILHLYLHNLDIPAALAAAGLDAAASRYHLRVDVQLADGTQLHTWQTIKVVTQ
jgi:hypothetical protein